MHASERFTPDAADALRDAIADAGGNEVFVAGRLDAQGLIAEVVVAARGGKASVPALSGFLDRGDVLIHNHPSGFLVPSDADMAVASRVGENGVGSYIVDNEVREVYVVAEPVRAKAIVALNPEELAGVLEAGGKLASRLKDYEPRASQLDLVKAIARAMNQGSVLAAEAGTGVGKSFAYLIPALAWAARNKERVVVSTATINLQRQLMDKDIPLVASIFRKNLKAVLVKGRGNYLCHTRLMEALDEEGLFAGSDHPLRRIADWAETSPSGDRADLSFWPEDADWSRVCSEADSCLGLRCPYRDTCFVLKVKRDAADSDLLVANHHILFSDLAARSSGAGYESTAVLPPFSIVILDEAHAVESSATSFFSSELAKFSVYKQLSRLYRERRGRKFGVMVKLQNVKGLPAELFKRLPLAFDTLKEAMAEADASALGLLGTNLNHRLTIPSAALDKMVLAPLSRLERAILEVANILKSALDDMPDEAAQEQAVQETELALHRLVELASLCSRFARFEDDPQSVYWLDRGRTGQGEAFVKFCITPISIAEMMNESVFEPFRSTICLSATLSVGGSFGFWKQRVGLTLSDAPSDCSLFPSPFPYETNAMLGTPTDAPTPDDPSWQAWVNTAVYDLVAASGGKALVLFTSYQVLRSCWEAVKPRLDALGLSAFRQGDDERSRLMDKFKANIASVLFATDSFWEGVDAPGETLELVIITKLPFRVPTDPIQMARAEAVEKHGGNAFMDLSLPEAVIRFKQGFGRLIRHSDDRGAVVVLDARLLKKRYGQLFVASLPSCIRTFAPLQELCSSIKSFIGRPIAAATPDELGIPARMNQSKGSSAGSKQTEGMPAGIKQSEGMATRKKAGSSKPARKKADGKKPSGKKKPRT
jgi:ATP-dependent DNA helicase DinG